MGAANIAGIAGIASGAVVARSGRWLAGAGHGPVEPPWLHTAGQIAGVALMIELLLALMIFAAIMGGLAYGAWWLSQNVVPVIGQYSAQAQGYIEIAERGTDRVAHGVATFHGARLGVAAGLKAFFLPGKRSEPQPPAIRPLAAAPAARQVATPATPATPAGTSTPVGARATNGAAPWTLTPLTASPRAASQPTMPRPHPVPSVAPAATPDSTSRPVMRPTPTTRPATVAAHEPRSAPTFHAAGTVAGTAAGRAGGSRG